MTGFGALGLLPVKHGPAKLREFTPPGQPLTPGRGFISPVKQLALFENVPPSAPTAAQCVARFKTAHGILTHSAACAPKQGKWLALKIPPRRLDNGEPTAGLSLSGMFAHFGRLLDEGGWSAYGATEREAIREVCRQQKLPCDL